jgi:hypothetical protein
MAKDPKQPSTSTLYGPKLAVAGKPYVYKFPTPSLTDRILSIRVDSRAGSFTIPNQGDPYDGPDAGQFAGFMFSTAAPIEAEPGFWNLFYVDQRANQDAYNYTIDYPYTDRDYPRLTRTYVFLRGSFPEPTAGEQDSIYNDNPNSSEDLKALGNLNLLLTDHKLVRFENEPILDSLFVGVTRVYERLPGPVIRTYEENGYQQIVTVDTQETQSGTTPLADAWTDVLKVERTTTAKQKNTIGKVPDVPGKNIFTQLWASPYRDFLPLPFRYLNPLVTTEHDDAGIASASDVILGPQDTTATSAQISEFRRHQSRTSAPIKHSVLTSERLSAEQQLVTIQETLDPGNQDISPDLGPLLVAAKVEQVGTGATIKTEETVTSVFPKQEEEAEIPNVIPLEFRATIPTIIEAQTTAGVIPIGTPPDLEPGQLRVRQSQETEYKMRTEITRIDPTPLPATLVDSKLLEDLPRSEGMSGVLAVTRILDAPAITGDPDLVVDQGFLVTGSEVRKIGAGLQLKTTEQIDQWPTLYEVHTDPHTGIVVNMIKTMVQPGTPYPGSGYVDILPIDKWRSIQIVSSVNCATLPAPYSWGSSYKYSLPPVLLSIKTYWNNSGKEQYQSASATDAFGNPVSGGVGAGVLAYASARGTITYTSTAGVHGDFPAVITRQYLCGPPPFNSIPNIFKFQPVDGSAVISGSSESISITSGPGGGDGTPWTGDASSVTSAAQDTEFLNQDRIDIRGVLTGFPNIVQQPTSSVSFTEVEATATDANGNDYPLSQQVAASSNLIVDLPLSNPGYYTQGQSFIVAVNVERWRFGIFIMETIAITIPPLPPPLGTLAP